MRKWKVSLLVLFVFIRADYSYGVNPAFTPIPSSVTGSIVQKSTDSPKDKAIKVVIHDGRKFCYGPIFSGGESYIIVEQCSEQHVMNARYDVFQRISYNINNTWLCITAPEKVIKAEQIWDYVHLRPCTINDSLQRWVLQGNAFWTADGNYRLKDINWYGYISRNSGDNYNHTLDSSMNDWVKTVATPGNISLQTSIAWDLNNSWGNERYFIRGGGSGKNTTLLYYNPESGHLAQYNSISGSLYCMYSQMGRSNWNWVKWALCNDAVISKDNPAFWNVSFGTDEGGIITDYQGNILRVTRYGSNWGVVYTAKPDFVKTDIRNSPTSLFVVTKDLLNWTRYVSSNLGKTEQYCPAGNHVSLGHKRIVRTLPPDFQLSEAWIRRLYQIAISTVDTTQGSGICGICTLQAFQMVAELQEYHSQEPLQSGGYFFDTAPNTDPFISFRQRYPFLDRLLTDIPRAYSSINVVPADNRNRLVTFASARTILPQYNWAISAEFTTRSEILSHVSSLIDSSHGSLWIAILGRRRPDGTLGWHAAPILRTSQGLVVMRTSLISASLSFYRQSLTPSTDPIQVVDNQLGRPDRALIRLITIQLVGSYQNSFDFMISNRNCTGEGEDRRGTGEYPTSSLVNQCLEGRCTLQ
ncbi:DUF1561 domain-containing protein [Leptospira interrogans]|uniref:DUF1561 domain-containing protein n=1 Tax=Leptospira interrogans TaxID=173 RepID=UPI00027856C3|nr:DUF1561 domain-containing protein [Leptospira interrogans]EJP16338.1 PF07598 family protein [Leptospira interrogans str. FPW2026]EMO91729.1 PF07598 family protein [Leptospira interrogans str. UI 13372]MCL8311497.1 DUF1561 domain-containing protein [Leptospira interrogans]QOI34094.1 DUF1561 domain-containing protein [Leptospira interrogans serovar Icterohaemorrhagiae]